MSSSNSTWTDNIFGLRRIPGSAGVHFRSVSHWFQSNVFTHDLAFRGSKFLDLLHSALRNYASWFSMHLNCFCDFPLVHIQYLQCSISRICDDRDILIWNEIDSMMTGVALHFAVPNVNGFDKF